MLAQLSFFFVKPHPDKWLLNAMFCLPHCVFLLPSPSQTGKLPRKQETSPPRGWQTFYGTIIIPVYPKNPRWDCKYQRCGMWVQCNCGKNVTDILMGTGHIRVITAISSMQGKWLIIPCRDPLPPQIYLVGQTLPLSCDPELWSESEDEDLTPISPPYPAPPRLLPRKRTHTEVPVSAPAEITPDTSSQHARGSPVSRDWQNFKVAIRRFIGENMLGLPQGKRNLKL